MGDARRMQLTFELMVPAADWALACAFPHPVRTHFCSERKSHDGTHAQNHFAPSGAARTLCGQARERVPPSRGGRRGPSFRARGGEHMLVAVALRQEPADAHSSTGLQWPRFPVCWPSLRQARRARAAGWYKASRGALQGRLTLASAGRRAVHDEAVCLARSLRGAMPRCQRHREQEPEPHCALYAVYVLPVQCGRYRAYTSQPQMASCLRYASIHVFWLEAVHGSGICIGP